MDARLETAPVTQAADRPWVITAALALGCAALLMLGVQPIVLGALVTAGRLDLPLLAQAATVEMLALGLVAGLLGAIVRHRHLVPWCIGGGIALVLGNVACLSASGWTVVGLRALAGAGGGVLVWIAAGVIGRSQSAVRLSAIFTGAQAVTQAVAAAIIPLGAPIFGASSGFGVIAIASILSLGFVFAIPRDLPDLPRSEEGQARLNVKGALGLSGAFLLMAAIVGVYVFVEQLGSQRGVSTDTMSFAVAGSLVMQVVAAALITWLGPRARPFIALPLICVGFIVCLIMMGIAPDTTVFVVAVLFFGFLWSASLPLFLPLLIEVDPTRRSTMLIAGAQLLGSSAGPLVMGFLVAGDNLQPVLWWGAGLFAVSAAIVGLVAMGKAKPANV